MSVRSAVGLLALVAMVGCESATAVTHDRPPNARPMKAPAWYAERYQTMEKCVGVTGDFSSIRWFVVPGRSWENTVDGRLISGQWWPPNDIYVSEESADDERVVDHEILHHLIQDHKHFVPPFGGACAPTRL